MFKNAFCALLISAVSVTAATADDITANANHASSKVSVVFDQKLPNVPGKSMRGVLVEYGPGGFSAAHTHPSSAFIYATVLEGSITSKVNDGPETVYNAGENFSEVPGDHHGVSANASKTKPARLLAVFVLNTDETELTTDDK